MKTTTMAATTTLTLTTTMMIFTSLLSKNTTEDREKSSHPNHQAMPWMKWSIASMS